MIFGAEGSEINTIVLLQHPCKLCLKQDEVNTKVSMYIFMNVEPVIML